MSSTRQIDVLAGTTVRKRWRGGSQTHGMGNSHRLYLGRPKDGDEKDYDHHSFLKFDLDWTNVGQIISAKLSVFTDDGTELFDFDSTAWPRAIIRILTAAFTEGNAPNQEWQANDYTDPAKTTSGEKQVDFVRGANSLTEIDITDFFEKWAPSTVKTRKGQPGGAVANHGIGLYGVGDNTKWGALFSEDDAEGQYHPFVTLVYEMGATTPDVPTNLSPSGNVTSLSAFQGDFTDDDPKDKLSASEVVVYDAGNNCTIATDDFVTDTAHGLKNGDYIHFTSLTGGAGLTTFTRYYVVGATANTFKVSLTSGGTAVDITDAYESAVWSKFFYARKETASYTEKTNARFNHVPSPASWVKTNRTYRWRARVWDNEGKSSAWTSLTSFVVTNTAPSAPTITPASKSFATLSSVPFRVAGWGDAEGGRMMAYEAQLSEYGPDDPNWDDPSFVLWHTGKRYVAADDRTSVEFQYSGSPLSMGTYYWRARVWDQNDGVSDWTYAQITMTANFEPDPDEADIEYNLRDRAPWRIVIKAMGALRGPGTTVAILENAKSVGASLMYNSPGEAHWTLPVDHPQLSVIEPKQTHYSIQFYEGDGWREKFAGLVWDVDATESDVVFYGIDYLALYDYVMDERYDPAVPDRPAEKGGSYYVTDGKNQIDYIVTDQLTRAKDLTNSPVGFITIGDIDEMDEEVAIYSTMTPTLQFVTGLLESHRAGQDKRTRIFVRPKTGGGYEVTVQDDVGVVKDNLRLKYGELVQGYRVVFFGQDWSTRVNTIGQTRQGLKVMYEKGQAAVDEAVWGRFARASLVQDVNDQNDLKRRTKQMSISASKLGKQVGLGLRSGILGPRDGYDLCDIFPISIDHGSVDTTAFGSGYWVAVGITWEASDQGQQHTILTFRPREDGTGPSTDLMRLTDISPQSEWQVGWTPPDVVNATSKYWLDQNTGIVYQQTHDEPLIEGPAVGDAATDTITILEHGLEVGRAIRFLYIEGGEGILEWRLYWVIAEGHTTDTFKFSDEPDGDPVDFTTDIYDLQIHGAPEYNAINGGTMGPPPTPPTPPPPTVTPISQTPRSEGNPVGAIPGTVFTPGIRVGRGTPVGTLPAVSTIRSIETQITSEFNDDTGTEPVFTRARGVTKPIVITQAELDDPETDTDPIVFPAYGEIDYAVRQRYQDVFGQYSEWSDFVFVTSDEGIDSIASLESQFAAVAESVESGSIEIDSFASGLRPVAIVATLPTLPDGDYPAGSVVLLTTDSKLYRNVADEWMRNVDGADLNPLSVKADAIEANAITAGKIEAGAISATHLSSTILLTSLLKAVGEDGRVEIDQNGLRAYDADSNIQVHIPSDGSPVLVRGNIDSGNLTIRGGVIPRSGGDVTGLTVGRGGEIRLLPPGSVEPPYASNLEVMWPTLDDLEVPGGLTVMAADKVGGGFYDANGGTSGSNPCYVAVVKKNDGKFYVVEWDWDDGTVDRTTEIKYPGHSYLNPRGPGYLTRIGDYWFWCALMDVDGRPSLVKITRSTGVEASIFTDEPYNHVYDNGYRGGFPLATNGTDLFVAATTGATTISVLRYNTSLVYQSKTDLTGLPSGVYHHVVIPFTIANIGSGDRYFLSLFHPTNGARVYEFNGASIVSNTDFPTRGWDEALMWDGTNFQSALPQGDRTRYTNWTWTTESSTYHVGLAWRADTVPVETEVGWGNHVNMERRKALRVQLSDEPPPEIGGATTDLWMVYAGRGSSSPDVGEFKFQTSVSVTGGVSSVVLEDFDSGGHADGLSDPYDEEPGYGSIIGQDLEITGEGEVEALFVNSAEGFFSSLGADIVDIEDDIVFWDEAVIRFRNVTDAGLTSTEHAFQIGLTSGPNIIMDNNEIMARDNGAASGLYLNADGGKVVINSNSSPTTNADGLAFGADVNLFRVDANVLRTDDSLQVGASLDVAGSIIGPNSGGASGTSTPTIGNGGSATFSTRAVRWVKIGRAVIFSINFTVSGNGSGASVVNITGTGLPEADPNFFHLIGTRAVAGGAPLIFNFQNVGGALQVNSMRTVDSSTAITGADLANTAIYILQGAYFAAS